MSRDVPCSQVVRHLSGSDGNEIRSAYEVGLGTDRLSGRASIDHDVSGELNQGR